MRFDGLVGPTSNEFKRMKRYKYRHLRDHIQAAMRGMMLDLDKVPMLREVPIYILIERSSKIACDEDNAGTSAKPFVDCLTKMKIIKDDKPIVEGGHVHIIVKPKKGKTYTRMVIGDLEDIQIDRRDEIVDDNDSE